MQIKALKNFLDTQSKDQLISDIANMCSKSDFVKDYYQNKLNPDNGINVCNKFKSIIKNEFFPARGYGRGRLSVVRKAVSDFRKVSESKQDIADIMIFYVEMGVQFTCAYGDIDESFYNSMESMYGRAVKYIVQNKLIGQFEDRCRKIVDDTCNIGWGFHDGLSDIFEGLR